MLAEYFNWQPRFLFLTIQGMPLLKSFFASYFCCTFRFLFQYENLFSSFHLLHGGTESLFSQVKYTLSSQKWAQYSP